MKQKYYEYKNIKQDKINKKKNQMEKIIMKKRNREITNIMANDLLNDIEKHREENIRKKELIDIFDELNNDNITGGVVIDHGPLNELDPRAKMYDNKFTEEIEKDGINNHLMSRLNSDIFINDMNKNTRKTFESPFSNVPDDRHAAFNQKNIPNKNFDNIRF